MSNCRGMRRQVGSLLQLLTSTEESISHKTSSSCHTQPKGYVNSASLAASSAGHLCTRGDVLHHRGESVHTQVIEDGPEAGQCSQ